MSVKKEPRVKVKNGFVCFELGLVFTKAPMQQGMIRSRSAVIAGLTLKTWDAAIWPCVQSFSSVGNVVISWGKAVREWPGPHYWRSVHDGLLAFLDLRFLWSHLNLIGPLFKVYWLPEDGRGAWRRVSFVSVKSTNLFCRLEWSHNCIFIWSLGKFIFDKVIYKSCEKAWNAFNDFSRFNRIRGETCKSSFLFRLVDADPQKRSS